MATGGNPIQLTNGEKKQIEAALQTALSAMAEGRRTEIRSEVVAAATRLLTGAAAAIETPSGADAARAERKNKAYQAAVDMASGGFRSFIVVSGGAIVAMLTLVGALANKGATNLPQIVGALSGSLILLCGALIGGFLAILCAYFSESYAALSYREVSKETKRRRYRNCWRGGAIVCSIASLLAFGAGAYFAMQAFAVLPD